MEKVVIYDTTLRDGSQGEGISFSIQDKVNITMKLDKMGVDYIEGGWPGSNKKDMEFFKLIAQLKLKHAKISAFCSTRRPNLEAEDDANLNALIESGAKTVAIFGKSWDFHVTEAFKIPLEENLKMIRSSIEYLVANGIEVFYDAEHFFDGYKGNRLYAMATIRTAEDSGAAGIILCDTNGGTLPSEVAKIVLRVASEFSIPVGVHCHNDGDLAVANSLIAVESGARHIQGTINGIGERCGNANLISIIPNLELKMGYQCLEGDGVSHLTEVAHYISEIANMKLPNNQPFVGQSAFAHKGGIHVSAVLKDPKTYEHLEPELVGNQRRVLVSELSGASNLRYKIQELNLDFSEDNTIHKAIIAKVKELEYEGYQFEGAEGSFELLLKKEAGQYHPGFELESFHINTDKRKNKPVGSESSIKIKVGDAEYHTAADGIGPVDALNNAIRKSLESFYPNLKEMHLTDYKVRVLDGKEATRSKVRVLIESADKELSWTTIGVSHDIIEASWIALTDSIGYKLMKDDEQEK